MRLGARGGLADLQERSLERVCSQAEGAGILRLDGGAHPFEQLGRALDEEGKETPKRGFVPLQFLEQARAGEMAVRRRRRKLLAPPGALEHAVDGAHQIRAADGLRQIIIHAGGEAVLAVALQGVGREGNDGHMRRGGGAIRAGTLLFEPADFARGLDPVQIGHLHVHEQDIERMPVERADGLIAVGGHLDGVAHLAQDSGDEFAVDRVVLRHEHAQRRAEGEGLRFGFDLDRADIVPRGSRVHRERHAEIETAAVADFAFDPEASAHHHGELIRDRQAQTRATVEPGDGGVGLGEGLKNGTLLLLRDAYARVSDGEEQLSNVRGRRRCCTVRPPALRVVHAHRDIAVLREFDGVADQIDQHLTQADHVASQGVGHGFLDLVVEQQALLPGTEPEGLEGPVEPFAQAQRLRVQLQLARFNLRVIEDVIDEREQIDGGSVGGHEVAALLRGEAGVEGQFSHADEGVHRGANLVADVGHELALGFACGLRGLVRPLQLVLRTLALRDVGGDAAQPVDGAIRVAQRELGGDIGVQPVVVRRDLLQLHGHLGLQHLLVVRAEGGRDLAGENVVIRAIPDRHAVHMEERLEDAIDQHVAAVGVLDVDHGGRIIEDGLHPVLAVAQRLLRALALRDVLADADEMRHHSLLVPDRRERELRPKRRAVLAMPLEHRLAFPPGEERVANRGEAGLPRILADEEAGLRLQEFLLRVARDRLHGRIDVADRVVGRRGVEDEDEVVRREQRALLQVRRLRHATGDLFGAQARAGQRAGDAEQQPADAQPAQPHQPGQKIIRRVIERRPAAEVNRPRPLGQRERHRLAMGAARILMSGVEHSVIIVEQVPGCGRGPVEDFEVNIIEGTVDHPIHQVRDDKGREHPALQAAQPLALGRHRLAVAINGLEQHHRGLALGILHQLHLRRQRGPARGGGEVAGLRAIDVASHVVTQRHPVVVLEQRLDEPHHVMVRRRGRRPDLEFQTMLRAGRPQEHLPPLLRHPLRVAERLDAGVEPLQIQLAVIGPPFIRAHLHAGGEESARALEHLLIRGHAVGDGLRDLFDAPMEARVLVPTHEVVGHRRRHHRGDQARAERQPTENRMPHHPGPSRGTRRRGGNVFAHDRSHGAAFISGRGTRSM